MGMGAAAPTEKIVHTNKIVALSQKGHEKPRRDRVNL